MTIAEITVKRMADDGKVLQIAKLDSQGRIHQLKTIGHKIGCSHKTITLDLDDNESVRVTAVRK